MKKILGISLVALFASVPMMAGAADLTEKTPATTDAQKVAAVSYVKGAYNAVASAVNTKQDQLKVGDADVSSAVSSEVRADGQADNATLVTEKAVRDAIKAADTTAAAAVSGLNTRLEAAEGSITTLTAGSGVEGSVAYAVAQEASARDAAISAAISDEETARDAAISTAISGEETARNAAISAAISGEETARNAAISTAISGEETARDAAITSAIEDLDATLTHTAGDDGLAITIVETDGVLSSITASIASGTYDKAGAASAAESAAKAYADAKFLRLTTNWTDETATSTVTLSNPSPAPAGSEVQG